MPIYEYRCRTCKHEFEQLVRSSRSKAKVACPQCGGGKVERRLSVFAARQSDAADSGPPSLPGPCGQCEAAGGSCPYSS